MSYIYETFTAIFREFGVYNSEKIGKSENNLQCNHCDKSFHSFIHLFHLINQNNDFLTGYPLMIK